MAGGKPFGYLQQVVQVLFMETATVLQKTFLENLK